MSSLTYKELFAFLGSVGFEDRSSNRFERVFLHGPSETCLAFSLLDNEEENQSVRPADILSAEIKLQHQGLITGGLKKAVEEALKS